MCATHARTHVRTRNSRACAREHKLTHNTQHKSAHSRERTLTQHTHTHTYTHTTHLRARVRTRTRTHAGRRVAQRAPRKRRRGAPVTSLPPRPSLRPRPSMSLPAHHVAIHHMGRPPSPPSPRLLRAPPFTSTAITSLNIPSCPSRSDPSNP